MRHPNPTYQNIFETKNLKIGQITDKIVLFVKQKIEGDIFLSIMSIQVQ